MADSFSRYLPGLRSPRKKVRERTVHSLLVFVESEKRDLDPEMFDYNV